MFISCVFITDIPVLYKVIQGTAEVNGKLTQAEISQTLDFCLNAFQESAPETRASVLQKVEGAGAAPDATTTTTDKVKLEANLTKEEEGVLKSIRARQMLRTEDILHIENFSADTIDGFAPHLERGRLGLVRPGESTEITDTGSAGGSSSVGTDAGSVSDNESTTTTATTTSAETVAEAAKEEENEQPVMMKEPQQQQQQQQQQTSTTSVAPIKAYYQRVYYSGAGFCGRMAKAVYFVVEWAMSRFY